MAISLVDIPEKKKWSPKTWRIEYDRIVGYSAGGLDNSTIADKLGFTKEYVSVILNLPEAKILYARIRANVQGKLVEDIPTRLAKIAEKAVERLEFMINDEELFTKNPFSIIDRGMDVIKGLGHLRGGGNGAQVIGDTNVIHNSTTTIISAGQKSDLMEGLEKIAEVHRLHSGPVKDENGK
jgi:hypothetical protein